MNRKERRALEKNGVSQETLDKMKLYDKPCTILEVVKLAQSVSEDVVGEALESYARANTGVILALSIQTELIKRMLSDAGLIDADKFQALYERESRELEEKQREYLREMAKKKQEEKEATKADASFSTDTMNPVEVTVLKGEEEHG